MKYIRLLLVAAAIIPFHYTTLGCDVCHSFGGVGGQNPGWYNAGFIALNQSKVHFGLLETDANPISNSSSIEFATKLGSRFRLINSVDYVESVNKDKAIGFNSGVTFFMLPGESEKRRTQLSIIGLFSTPKMSATSLSETFRYWSASSGVGYVIIRKKSLWQFESMYTGYIYRRNSRLGDYARGSIFHHVKLISTKLKKSVDERDQFSFLVGIGIIGERFGPNVRNGFLLINTGGKMIRSSLRTTMIYKRMTLMGDLSIPTLSAIESNNYNLNSMVNIRLMYKTGAND